MRKFSVLGFVLLSIENVIIFLPVRMPLRKSLIPSCRTSHALPQSVYWGVTAYSEVLESKEQNCCSVTTGF